MDYNFYDQDSEDEFFNILSYNNRVINTQSPQLPATVAKTTSPTPVHVNYSNNWNFDSSSLFQSSLNMVWEADGIEFWGGPKSKVEDISATLDEHDLVINCTGFPISVKNWIMEKPEWLSLNYSLKKKLNTVLFDWKDAGVPPSDFLLDDWKIILKQAKENSITRIICCCTGGIGRTGTALSVFWLLTHEYKLASEAILFLRENYNKNACETAGQENYIFNLKPSTEEELSLMKESVKKNNVFKHK